MPILFRSQDKTLGEVQDRLEEIRERAENALVGNNPAPDEEKEKTEMTVKQIASHVRYRQGKARQGNSQYI